MDFSSTYYDTIPFDPEKLPDVPPFTFQLGREARNSDFFAVWISREGIKIDYLSERLLTMTWREQYRLMAYLYLAVEYAVRIEPDEEGDEAVMLRSEIYFSNKTMDVVLDKGVAVITGDSKRAYVHYDQVNCSLEWDDFHTLFNILYQLNSLLKNVAPIGDSDVNLDPSIWSGFDFS